ncbi:Aerobic C4-dicarboxylate transport protein [compost metagenome]
MVLLLGVDRFMSEARAITNTIGNGVGTMAIAKWVGALDTEKMHKALNGDGEKTVAVQAQVLGAPQVGVACAMQPSLGKATQA